MKIRNWKLKISGRDGQSLIEVLIGLAIGAVLIGAASLGVTFMLRSSASSQNVQIGTGLAQDLVDKVRSVSAAKWQDVYNLTKGTSTSYFVNASGTQLITVEGQEGVISNENTNGLIGYWKMDETTSTATTTTFDASGNGYHGTLTNGPTRATTTCKISYCLSFDGGNDYVSTPNQNYGNDVTLAVWFKGGSQTPSDWNYWLNSTVNWLEFGTFSDSATFKDNNATGTPSVSAGSTFTDNNWHHAVGVIRSNVMEIWIDGTLKASRSDYPTGQSHTNVGHRIGGNGVARGWAGLIDDVRIYNRGLPADEIQRLWNSVVFTRYFNVTNVNRDTNGNIVSSGGNEDPSTQKITVTVQWPGTGTNVGQIQLVDYLTRWQNQVFQQTDWLGGSGQTGVITSPNSQYDSATSISNPAGSIRIQGL